MKGQDRLEKAVFVIICIGLIFFLLAAPAVTAWGVITGRLDVKTVEPSGTAAGEGFGGD